jgi:hypothetical protein
MEHSERVPERSIRAFACSERLFEASWRASEHFIRASGFSFALNEPPITLNEG